MNRCGACRVDFWAGAKKGRTGGRGGVSDTVFRGQGSRTVQWSGGVGVKEDGLLRISSVGGGGGWFMC